MADRHEQHYVLRLVFCRPGTSTEGRRNRFDRCLRLCKGMCVKLNCVRGRRDAHRDSRDAITIPPHAQKKWLLMTLQDALRDLSNWSVGPTFRGYVSNADSYVRIRVEEF